MFNREQMYAIAAPATMTATVCVKNSGTTAAPKKVGKRVSFIMVFTILIQEPDLTDAGDYDLIPVVAGNHHEKRNRSSPFDRRDSDSPRKSSSITPRYSLRMS